MVCEIGGKRTVAAASGGVFGKAVIIGEYSNAEILVFLVALPTERQDKLCQSGFDQSEIRFLVDFDSVDFDSLERRAVRLTNGTISVGKPVDTSSIGELGSISDAVIPNT